MLTFKDQELTGRSRVRKTMSWGERQSSRSGVQTSVSPELVWRVRGDPSQEEAGSKAQRRRSGHGAEGRCRLAGWVRKQPLGPPDGPGAHPGGETRCFSLNRLEQDIRLLGCAALKRTAFIYALFSQWPPKDAIVTLLQSTVTAMHL